MRGAAVVALACAGAVVGVLAERQAYDWADLGAWLPDLLAGWTLIGCGAVLLALRRPPGAPALLLVAGFSWFAFNFRHTGPAAVQWLAVHAAYLHRGPLLQLALAPPAGRPGTRLAAVGVALAWAAAVFWPLWNGDVSALLLCVAFVAVALRTFRRARGWRSRAIASRGLLAVALVSAAIGADALRSLAGAPQDVTDVTVLAYQLAVVLAAVVLFGAALLGAPASLAERAVALEGGHASLRDALRDLLGDPRLEIVLGPDDVGRRANGLAATPVGVSGTQVATVLHDPAALDDPATRTAVLAAVGLAAERERLQAEVTRQVEAVESSRRRLLVAEEEERRRLAARLDHGPGAALASVEQLVRAARAAHSGDEALAAALARAGDGLTRVRPEVDLLVRGLGGVGADGLRPALERLAAGLPVELDVGDVDVSPETAAALWFVCSESLANAVKHADARSISVRLEHVGGVIRLTVQDDGRGGADPSGPGLLGLADRVAALGGRLAVVSPAGDGTRVVAELPADG